MAKTLIVMLIMLSFSGSIYAEPNCDLESCQKECTEKAKALAKKKRAATVDTRPICQEDICQCHFKYQYQY